MFERFTEQARHVLVYAQEEARALEHNYIGTEHILLGLVRHESLAARVLASLDITLERVRAQVVAIVGYGNDVSPGQMRFTPRAKKVLELALQEAVRLGDGYIGAEHMLLGLARENQGVAVRILLDFDADPEKIRSAVIRALAVSSTARSSPLHRRGESLREPASAAPERPSATTLPTPEVGDWALRGRVHFGWRSRPIALAALGAASMSRRAFDPRASGDLEPLALQLLVAVALSQPAGDEGRARGDGDRTSLRALLCCDDEELEDATAALLAGGLIGVQETRDPFDPDEHERWLFLTGRGSAFVETWLGRVAPLFRRWPPSPPDVDDAH